MAARKRPRDGYWHTSAMLMADDLCRERHGCSLRAYLLRWRNANPSAALAELAAEFHIDRGTLNDWLDKLRISRGGVMFIDLDSPPVATGTDG